LANKLLLNILIATNVVSIVRILVMPKTLYIIIERSAPGSNRTHVLTKRVIQISSLLLGHRGLTFALADYPVYDVRYPRFHPAQAPQLYSLELNDVVNAVVWIWNYGDQGTVSRDTRSILLGCPMVPHIPFLGFHRMRVPWVTLETGPSNQTEDCWSRSSNLVKVPLAQKSSWNAQL